MIRRNIIKEIIQTKPYITLAELEKKFPDVSSMTLRRDIDYFERQGDVIKVRGGARSMKFIKTSMEDSFENRTMNNIDAKNLICKKALEFMEIGRSIFFDSGTTMMLFSDMIDDERYTITTTAPNIAIKLLKNNNIIVNLVGGMVNRDNISISGTQAINFLSSINIDIAFIVPSGYSQKNGFTCGNYNECEIKKLIISKARRKIILFDSQKIGKSLPYTFANIEDADVIITDADKSEDILKESEKNKFGDRIIYMDQI